MATQGYNHNYQLLATDFPTVTADAGYTVKWYDAESGGTEYSVGSAVTAAATLFSRQVANTNTPYSVKHYRESLTQSAGGERVQYNSIWYECESTQNKVGTTDTQTAAEENTYIGFTANSFFQATINGNGNTVVNIYYARNIIDVNYTSAAGATGTITKKYGSTLLSSDLAQYAGCGQALGSRYFLNWYLTGGTASSNFFCRRRRNRRNISDKSFR